MAMSFVKAIYTCSLSTSIFNSPPTKAMAMSSSFCNRTPNHFSGRPISSFPTKPTFSLSFKAFCSQTSASTAKADEMPVRIGFLGLGIMGSPMAQNLIKAGCDLTVWNRTKNKCDPLISLGANSGDKPLFETAAPFLDIMGKSRFFLGDVGNGAAMKLVVNMIMGSMMASFSEGLLLSEKVGLDPSVLVEVVSQGAISAPMFSMKGPSMVQSLYPTAFPLKHQQKDLRLALGLAESVSQPTPIAAAANEMYKVAKSRGLSDQDFSAVIEALKVKLQNQSD
ncbi:Glyoxylate/succinic semialdehyde reductase [Actinidia chinensis var. chinensis]|uniref:Glyoxylate/succinic semialdehyde reductase n=1 Tax=Actinidia chinensis var. chinensis TaxID=1590841 RepID=A0A2R6PSV0_ACTCC|nr:Glyoxylate/succinic semialdehyde reductase [Actinidia chinensis var. chinensis]